MGRAYQAPGGRGNPLATAETPASFGRRGLRFAGPLTPAEAVSVAYFDAAQAHMGALAPPPPAGNRECEEAFEQRAGAAVLLGQMSIDDAAQQFMDEASDILGRAA